MDITTIKTLDPERVPLRTFIAADFPQEILKKIGKITAYFKTQSPPKAIKWVDTDHLHLTIKFIGDLPEENLPSAEALLRETLKAYAPFSVSVGGLGVFPSPKRPRVIWLGVQGPAQLMDIHYSLNRACTEVGVKPEKRAFHPHLTLGRVRRHVGQDLVHEIGETFSQFKVDTLGSAPIEEIILYESKLTPQGPIYTPLFVVPLHQV